MHQVIPKRALAAVVSLALSFLAAPIYSAIAQEKANATVVAKVNGQPITEADMHMAENELGADLHNLPQEVKRRALAEYLIDNILFAEAAEAANLASAPEFEEQMRYLRRRVLRERYFETLRGAVSEDEAKKIYDARVTELKPEDEVSARHILVDSEDKAKELRAKIVAGADFAELAKENSADRGSKDKGGLLGYFAKGQLVPEFEAAVFKLKKGEVSEPVHTNYGWHIIKLEDRRRKEPPSFESVKNTIMNSLAVRKAQDKATELRNKAKLEYVDADIMKQVEAQKKQQPEAAKAQPNQPAAPPGAAPKK